MLFTGEEEGLLGSLAYVKQHQSEMTNYRSINDHQFQSTLQTQMDALSAHFGPAQARYPAELQLYHQLLYQATDWAFVDVFRWLALLCLSGAGIVWLFKRVQKGRPPAGAGAH